MQLSAKEAWKRILEDARRELPEHAIRTWLEPTSAIALDGAELVIGAPDQFAVEWNETKHALVLAKLAEPLLGHATRIVFRVQEERQQRPQMDFFVAPPASAPVPAAAIRSTQPLNERYTFDTFVIGKSNELAAAAAHAVAEAPGKTYNPLFIYGATGLGKTHLMQAIAHDVAPASPRDPGALRRRRAVHQRGHRGHPRPHHAGASSAATGSDVDLLLVDDVHFLEGKEATQEEFFHTFNALYEAGKQIVLTSDRPPKELPGPRGPAGQPVRVGDGGRHRAARPRAPDRHPAEEAGAGPPRDRPSRTTSSGFIAENVRSNVRELEGCIIKLLLFASLKHREITIELAREALADKIRARARRPPVSTAPALPCIDKVQEVVARRWGVTPEGLAPRRGSRR